MERIFLFDGNTDELVAVAGKNDGMLPFYKAPAKEQLNKDFTFDFSVPANHANAIHVKEGNIVGYLDLDGNLQAFNIYKVEDVHNGETLEKVAYAEHVFYELLDDIVEDLRVVDGTATDAVTKAIDGSRWQVGIVDSFGTNNIRFYYSNGVNNLKETVNTYGGELRFRLTFNGGKITGRYVDLLARRGADTGKRFEYKKDIESIKRTIDNTDIKTALYGRGKSSETDAGGYTRKADFADVEWAVLNGDPVDKPLGQTWVGDPNALALYGRVNGTRHRFGVVDFSEIEDPAELLQATWDYLQEVNMPRLTYEISIVDLERIAGLAHEAVRLGDTVFIIDRDLDLTVEARVIEIERNVDDPANGKVTLGNFIPLFTDVAVELNKIKNKLNEKEGLWDSGATVTDGSIDVVAPSVPTNVVADGLFESINITWDFDPSITVAGYEVYGSQVQGFTPDSSNLLWRGKSGGYNHTAEPNQTWYFVVRAFNPNGDYSAFSAEVQANTAQIHGDYLEDLTVGNSKIGDLSADKIKFGTLDGSLATITNMNASNINAGLLKAQYVEIGASSTFEDGYDPQPIISQFMDKGFVFGNKYWSNSVEGEIVESATQGTVVESAEAQSGPNVVQITGYSEYYTKNAIPIDPSRTYRVTFRVRQTVDATTAGNSSVYAGVACLDANYASLGNSYSGATVSEVMVADGWQTFTGLISGEGTTADTFKAGTNFVRPMFIVNYPSGDGTVEVDMLNFEDITDVNGLDTRLTQTELKVTDENIIATVTNTQAFQDKADKSALGDYATNAYAEEQAQDAKDYADSKIDPITTDINTLYTRVATVEQTADDLDFKFTSSGGVNLLKNSVGFAGTDFWTVTVDTDGLGQPIGTIDTEQNAELQEQGAGSAFVLAGGKLTQQVSTVSQFYTISTLVKKGTSGSGYLKVIYDDTEEVVTFDSGTDYNYEQVVLTIQPVSKDLTVEIYGDNAGEVTLTNTMVNVGNTALQWQHSAGEVYNTNVLMDLNGIRVISNTYNGYTAITPEEFAGYAEVGGVMERVFTLNKDVTEMSKVKIDKELSMTPIKVIPVQSANYNGWAFIKET